MREAGITGKLAGAASAQESLIGRQNGNVLHAPSNVAIAPWWITAPRPQPTPIKEAGEFRGIKFYESTTPELGRIVMGEPQPREFSAEEIAEISKFMATL